MQRRNKSTVHMIAHVQVLNFSKIINRSCLSWLKFSTLRASQTLENNQASTSGNHAKNDQANSTVPWLSYLQKLRQCICHQSPLHWQQLYVPPTLFWGWCQLEIACPTQLLSDPWIKQSNAYDFHNNYCYQPNLLILPFKNNLTHAHKTIYLNIMRSFLIPNFWLSLVLST